MNKVFDYFWVPKYIYFENHDGFQVDYWARMLDKAPSGGVVEKIRGNFFAWGRSLISVIFQKVEMIQL